ncbi:ATP synthase F1 subunit delta [Bacteroidia bacterium]|nr:ATP synthase F1 subunit delta [Bacteroidia bacterium]
MASSRIALRYSKSLLDLATEGNKVEEVKNDMDTVRNICSESRELSNLLNNPIVKSEAKKAVMDKVFSDTNEITKNFISFLVDKKRESELPMVADYYISCYNDMKGIAKATIVSAVSLTDETLKQMKTYVVGLLGKEDI